MSKFKIGERAKYNNKLIEICKIKGVSTEYYTYSVGNKNIECHNHYMVCWVDDINKFGLRLCFGLDEHEITSLNSQLVKEKLGIK